MIHESARAEFWPTTTTSPRRAGQPFPPRTRDDDPGCGCRDPSEPCISQQPTVCGGL